MSLASPFPLVAVDVGNSRIKCGLFSGAPDVAGHELPKPERTLTIDPTQSGWIDLNDVCGEFGVGRVAWRIASVQRKTSATFIEKLRELGVENIALLTSRELPLEIALPQPDRVGIDRLLGAVAANRLRTAGQAAIVVHVGSAITVNLVAADGSFQGGAILPGIAMSARAMHQFTDLLPLVDMAALSEPPAPVGDATQAAMTSGLFWGAVGGIRQLIELYSRHVGGEPLVLLTGGAAPSVARLLGTTAHYDAHLVLSGIALAVAHAE